MPEPIYMKDARLLAKIGCIFLLSLSFADWAAADQLTLYAYPAPIKLNWSSPSAISWTTIADSLVVDPQLKAIHDIGHLNFHLTCDPSAELPNGADIETGQTNSDDSQLNDAVLTEGYGLGAMITDYSGKWENQADIEADLPVRYQRGSIAYIDFKITGSSCARAVQYLTEYQALGLDKIYAGLERQAREGHGSGCSSFATSVLEIAGVMSPEMQAAWTDSVNIPDGLIGGPITGNNVSILAVLFEPLGWSWSSTADGAFPINFWDPYRVYKWIKRANRKPLSITGMTYTPSNRGNAKGIEVDATQVPTPTDPFWQ
jgi:hypothetical protein